MRAVRTFLVVGLIAIAGWTSSRAAERVDLLLVLAADISRSVDEVKFQLQRSGYAAAFSDSRVIEAIRGGPSGRIAVAFVEWSGPLQFYVSGSANRADYGQRPMLFVRARGYFFRKAEDSLGPFVPEGG